MSSPKYHLQHNINKQLWVINNYDDYQQSQWANNMLYRLTARPVGYQQPWGLSAVPMG